MAAKVKSLPFNEAIDYFQQKLLIPSRQWEEILGPVHAKAFTVAGATSLSLLQDIYSALQNALLDGTTITQFRKDWDDIIARHGWSYKGKRGWRTRVIFQVNKSSANAAGRWAQMWRLKDRRPYFQYLTVGDERVRENHKTWHRKVFRLDDPVLLIIYPPNGWLCRCKGRSLSERELKRQGLRVETNARLDSVEVIDPATGESSTRYKGIDQGWEYNVGHAWLAPEAALGEQLLDLPNDMRKLALDWMDTDTYDRPFSKLVNKVGYQIATGRTAVDNVTAPVGYINNQAMDGLMSNALVPKSLSIMANSTNIGAWIDSGLAMSAISALPSLIRNPELVIYDQAEQLVLFLKRLKNGEYLTASIDLNLKQNLSGVKLRFNDVLNLNTLSPSNLQAPQYKVLSGRIQ